MSERGSGTLTIDQWLALNDEIVALVRAGLPLERGLDAMGRGRLGEASRLLKERMERGETLDQALEAESGRVPPIYRAVVKAGVRSGRLDSALEGIASYARSFVEMRRLLGLAMIYPLLVITLAYVLLLGFLWFVLPPFASAFESLRLPHRRSLAVLEALARTSWYWLWVPPALLTILAVAWVVSGRVRSFPGMSRVFAWVPGARKVVREISAANFAELLAILVEHDVPMPDAVELASEAAGSAALRQGGRSIAEVLRQGTTPTVAATRAADLPPLLGWILAWSGRQGTLPSALRSAAEMYRRRARLRTDLMRTMLPALALLVVGATTALVYGLVLFLPLSALLDSASRAIG